MTLVCCSCGGARARPQLSANEVAEANQAVLAQVASSETRVGAAFVVGADGLVVSALHLVEGQSNLRVRLRYDPVEYVVTSIAGLDKVHDLALLRIEPHRALPIARLGESSALAVNDRVYDLGRGHVLDGTISQIRRLSMALTIVQIRTANPREWSGPVFDTHGDVVGIAVASIPTGEVIAVPIEELKPMLKHPMAMLPADFAIETAPAPQAPAAAGTPPK